MPIVLGNVIFSPTRTTNVGTGIPNVPIIIRDTSTGVGIAVLTDSSGAYLINNVPAGSYTLVEAWGQVGGVTSPADFATATVISPATPKDPPVSAVTSPPTGTNRIDSLSPNTGNITVLAANVIRNFTDTPVMDIPFVVNDLNLIGPNLITSANFGDWGTLPAGTPVSTRPATEPYPGVSPSFIYTSGVVGANQYTVSNIINGFNENWWNLADHTSGDETGRMEVLNGGPVGNSFFRQTVSVNPDTYYLFSSWFANIVNVAGIPAGPGVRITNLSGTTLFTSGATNIPSSGTLVTWNQIGSLFNTGNNTAVIVNFIDVNGGASGNDYVADDFSLTQAEPSNILQGTIKYASKALANIGDILTYSIVIRNNGASTAENIVIIDTIPNGTTFQSGTVRVNGVPFATKNPSPPSGLTLPNLSGASITTLTFDVLINSLPNPNPIPNSANLSYAYAPVAGGTTLPFAVNTNTVTTQVGYASLSGATKTVDKAFADCGESLTYTISMPNSGTLTALNVVLRDTIPNGTVLLPTSVYVNGVQQLGANPTTGITVPNIAPGATASVVYSVLVQC